MRLLCLHLADKFCIAFYDMGDACELLGNPQAAEGHFCNALSVIDGCSELQKMSLSYQHQLGKLIPKLILDLRARIQGNIFSIFDLSTKTIKCTQSIPCLTWDSILLLIACPLPAHKFSSNHGVSAG